MKQRFNNKKKPLRFTKKREISLCLIRVTAIPAPIPASPAVQGLPAKAALYAGGGGGRGGGGRSPGPVGVQAAAAGPQVRHPAGQARLGAGGRNVRAGHQVIGPLPASPCVPYAYPTTNGDVQNGSSVGMCSTRRTHAFARLAPICMLCRCLSNAISASELSRKFIKSALLVGYSTNYLGHTICDPDWDFSDQLSYCM